MAGIHEESLLWLNKIDLKDILLQVLEFEINVSFFLFLVLDVWGR